MSVPDSDGALVGPLALLDKTSSNCVVLILPSVNHLTQGR